MRRMPVERGPPTRDVRTDLQVQCVIHHLIMPCLLPHFHDNEDQGESQVKIDKAFLVANSHSSKLYSLSVSNVISFSFCILSETNPYATIREFLILLVAKSNFCHSCSPSVGSNISGQTIAFKRPFPLKILLQEYRIYFNLMAIIKDNHIGVILISD